MIPLGTSDIWQLSSIEFPSDAVHGSFFFDEQSVDFSDAYHFLDRSWNQNHSVRGYTFAFAVGELQLRFTSGRNKHSPQAISWTSTLFETEPCKSLQPRKN